MPDADGTAPQSQVIGQGHHDKKDQIDQIANHVPFSRSRRIHTPTLLRNAYE